MADWVREATAGIYKIGGVRGGVGGGKMGREVGEIRVFDLGGWGENFGQEVGGMGPAQVESVGGSGAGRSSRARGQPKWGYEDPFQGLRGPTQATGTGQASCRLCTGVPYCLAWSQAELTCGGPFYPTLQAIASWHYLVAGTRDL